MNSCHNTVNCLSFQNIELVATIEEGHFPKLHPELIKDIMQNYLALKEVRKMQSISKKIKSFADEVLPLKVLKFLENLKQEISSVKNVHINIPNEKNIQSLRDDICAFFSTNQDYSEIVVILNYYDFFQDQFLPTQLVKTLQNSSTVGLNTIFCYDDNAKKNHTKDLYLYLKMLESKELNPIELIILVEDQDLNEKSKEIILKIFKENFSFSSLCFAIFDWDLSYLTRIVEELKNNNKIKDVHVEFAEANDQQTNEDYLKLFGKIIFENLEIPKVTSYTYSGKPFKL